MKKLISLFLTLVMVVGVCIPASAISDEEVKAQSAVLMEVETGEVLYEKNSHEQRSAASITKVMTLLLVMEAIESGKISLEDTVTVSEHASSMGGSQIWLKVGEQMTVDEMIKATVIASANDAATALAEYVSGTEEEFVAQMNKRAEELEMKDTVFKNCNGLDEDGHHTSAYDVGIMSAELIQHEKIKDYTLIWMDYLRDGETELVNTNKLVKSYSGITGLKTGTTEKAGNCVTATAQRDGMQLVAVILAGESGAERFNSAARLLDYGYANWCTYDPKISKVSLDPVEVTNGMETLVAGEVNLDKEKSSILIPQGREEEVKVDINMDESLEAPVEKNQVIGKIIVKLDEKTLSEHNILATENVEEITFSRVFNKLLHHIISINEK